MRPEPETKQMLYGRLRYYKCRVCGRPFKAHSTPERERTCAWCSEHPGNDKDHK